jgi:hypothetical protein
MIFDLPNKITGKIWVFQACDDEKGFLQRKAAVSN